MSEIFDPTSGEMIEGALSPERMVDLYAVAIKQADRFRDMAAKLEFDMLQYMDEQGATAIPHARFNVEVTQANSYDKARFKPLLEIFNETDLDKCYTAPHTKRVDVSEAWDTVKVKAAARRYGTKAVGVVESAILPGPRRIKFSVIDPVDSPIG